MPLLKYHWIIHQCYCSIIVFQNIHFLNIQACIYLTVTELIRNNKLQLEDDIFQLVDKTSSKYSVCRC